MSYEIEHYIVGSIGTNCYFLINEDTKETVVIDPGASGKKLDERLRMGGHKPVAILLTHGHFDHAGGVEELLSLHPDEDIPVYACEKERETLADPNLNLSLDMEYRSRSFSATDYLSDGEVIEAAGFSIELIFTPGHTPGGCCFYLKKEGICFTGDTLFCGSVGRSDFPGGSMSVLIGSIKERLMVLPDDTVCYPGHNEITTIGDERKYNAFL